MDPPDGKQWLCGLGKGQPLFVRDCYAWFYEEVIRKMSAGPQCPGLIYTGNPGIGKSAWLNYALVRFLQDGYVVVLERAKTKDYFVFDMGRSSHTLGFVNIDLLSAVPEKAVYLFDPDEKDSCPLESNDVFTVVASSPQEKHYKALKKKGAGRYYFPCWSLEELQHAVPRMDVLQLGGALAKVGRHPTVCFHSRTTYAGRRPAESHYRVEPLRGFQVHEVAKISEEDQKMISHILVQYRVLKVDDAPFQFVELDFASDWIGERIVETQAQRDYHNLIAHYEEARRTQWQGAYSGHLWEHLCHAIIPLSSTKDGLKLEPLAQGKNTNRRVIKKAVAVRKGKLEDMMVALEDGCYFQPWASNFSVIDAAVMEGSNVFGFQMTVGSKHPPKAHEAVKLLTALPAGKRLHLVWVVDSAKEAHIKTAQTFKLSKSVAKNVNATQMSQLQALPQWLLKLSFPKESPFLQRSDAKVRVRETDPNPSKAMKMNWAEMIGFQLYMM